MTHRSAFSLSLLSVLVTVLAVSSAISLLGQTTSSTSPQENIIPNTNAVPRVWLHTDSEPPEMKLILSDDGVCKFQNGFLFWNPGKWIYDPASSQLTLAFPKMSKKDFKSTLKYSKRDHIISFNSQAKSITYQILRNVPQITFQGRVFFPDTSGTQ